MRIQIIVSAALSMLAAQAEAHDLWIERDGLQHTLIYGHERSGHAGTKTLEYDPANIKQAQCFGKNGLEIKTAHSISYPVKMQADCAVSWFLMSSGYWSKTAYGTKNLAKNEASAVIESWLSFEGVKRIDQWSSRLASAFTDSLELAPLDNPLQLKTGDKLHLRAWYRGKPAAGVTVAYFGKPRGITDADGKVNVRLVQPGFQLIQASLELPLNDPRADKTIHGSSLQFSLP